MSVVIAEPVAETDEHVHSAACHQDNGLNWCTCGTHYRKDTCIIGVWHHVSTLYDDQSCPCEREARAQTEDVVTETQTGKHRKEKRCGRRPLHIRR